MKNKRLTLILIFALIVSTVFTSVSCKKSKQNTQETTSPDIMIPSETDTLELPTHLSPEGSLTESETDTTPSNKDNENSETAKTPEESPAPESQQKESLKFLSYGNGTCAVSGIGTCTDSCIVIPERSPDGDVVTTISEKAFFGNSEIKAVEIPSTVTSIEDMAFGDCSSLVYVSVDSANKSFIDLNGVLFSIDLSRIIAYPSASGSVSISIPKSVKSIAPMAFYGCDTLKTIVFDGTLEDWGRIDIGDKNYGLFTASLTYYSDDK